MLMTDEVTITMRKRLMMTIPLHVNTDEDEIWSWQRYGEHSQTEQMHIGRSTWLNNNILISLSF